MDERARQRRVSSKAATGARAPLLSVLVPIDLSPISDRILARVGTLPLAGDATITVLHVVPAGLPIRDQQSGVRDAKRALAGEVRHLADSLPRSVA